MKPPFEINAKILDLCTEIGRLLGQYEGLKYPVPKPILRRQNRIKTIQASLSIEGNTLSIEQVSAIVEHKKVVGPPKDIIEVQNAIKAYSNIPSYNIKSSRSLCEAHGILMKNLIPNAGKWRSKNVGIVKGKTVAHLAPKAELVPSLMKNVFTFLTKDKETHSFIKSSVFHYELEFIHPFSDGNGRVGRLWQSTILTKYHPLFEYIPLESIVKKRQNEYYKALEKSDKKGKSTDFIEFSLEAIYLAIEEFLLELRPEPQTPEKRLSLFREQYKKSIFSRKDYMSFFKTISTPTASRDLLYGVTRKMLKKKGDKATTRYEFS